MAPSVLVVIQNLSKRFGNAMILQDISFSLHRGDLLAILGRSGSGKTTLLKCLAGLEPPDSGQIVVDGQDVRRLKPQVRGMVYLYQEPLLFPHLNVFENVAFGLRLKKIAEKEVKTQVNADRKSTRLNSSH